MKAEKEGSESNAENTRQSATTFSNNEKIYQLCYEESDQCKKITCQIHYKFKGKERSPHHLIWNQEQRIEYEKACLQGSVHCGEHEHTAEKESVLSDKSHYPLEAV